MVDRDRFSPDGSSSRLVDCLLVRVQFSLKSAACRCRPAHRRRQPFTSQDEEESYIYTRRYFVYPTPSPSCVPSSPSPIIGSLA